MIHNNIRHKEHNNKHKQMQDRYGQHNKTVIKGDCTLHNHAQRLLFTPASLASTGTNLTDLTSNLPQYHRPTRNIIKNTTKIISEQEAKLLNECEC